MKFKKIVSLIILMIIVYSFWGCSSNFNYKIETLDHSVLIDYGDSIVEIEVAIAEVKYNKIKE